MENRQAGFSAKAAVMRANSAHVAAGCPPHVSPPDNMKPGDAARYLGLSQSLLAKMRMKCDPRTGPPFARVGKAIIYRRADLDAWLAGQVEHAA